MQSGPAGTTHKKTHAGGLNMANEKVAVVAGVGPGIGARFVETFAQEGYRVVALARHATSLDRVRWIAPMAPLGSVARSVTSLESMPP